MDTLPPELKQRICSFLSPKQLKPLRLTCKVFAAAAERYLLQRFILFNHPDSLTALRDIADHEVFSRYLTTVVYDTMFLEDNPDYETWRLQLDDHQLKYPSWDDYRPRSVVLSTEKSYAVSTIKRMRCATDRYMSAFKSMGRALKSDWQKHQDIVAYQTNESFQLELFETVFGAFKKCRSLKNIVVSPHHRSHIRKSRSELFKANKMFNVWNFEKCDNPEFDLWEIMPMLESLSMISMELVDYPGFVPGRIFNNLKHLRIYHDEHYHHKLRNLKEIFSGACCLETFTLRGMELRATMILQAIRSDRLRVCNLHFRDMTQDALVDFLLHHSSTIERLRLDSCLLDEGSWPGVFGRISCQFPNLKRVQIQNVGSSPGYTRDYETQIEKTIMHGGTMPEEEHQTSHQMWFESQGCLSKDYVGDTLSPGLWEEYEYFANDSELGHAQHTWESHYQGW